MIQFWTKVIEHIFMEYGLKKKKTHHNSCLYINYKNSTELFKQRYNSLIWPLEWLSTTMYLEEEWGKPI